VQFAFLKQLPPHSRASASLKENVVWNNDGRSAIDLGLLAACCPPVWM
jgi:hypothetical protein